MRLTESETGSSSPHAVRNTQVRIQSRTGTTLRTMTPVNFWTSTNIGSFTQVFDPRVVYDPYNNILTLLACAVVPAQTQGTIQFKAILTGSGEVPPNGDPTIGTAMFTLDGNSLSFFVYVPALTFLTSGGTINRPALPGSLAPVTFDLGGFKFHSGSTLGDPPFYSSASPASPPFGAGPFTLSDQQISQIESGLWYVNLTSGPQPDGQLRGQILPVPESSVLALMRTGAVLACVFRRRFWQTCR